MMNVGRIPNVGDTVKAGDTVLHIAADQFASMHEEAVSALSAKNAELDLLMSGPKSQEVARAQAEVNKETEILRGAERDLQRADSLHRKNLLPLSELERLQTAAESQRARLVE